MSGLSDSAWEALAAEIEGGAAEPSPAETESPEALVQTEPDPTAPDVAGEDTPVADVVAAEPEPDPRLADIEAREAALAQAEAERIEREQRLAAQWALWQEQEAEKQSNAYYQELAQLDPELAKNYLGLRQGIMQQRREAEQRAAGAERGLTAAMIALEQVVTPEQFQQVLAMTEQLVTLPDANQMQAAIQQERQRMQAAEAEKRALEQTIRELRSQLEAKARPELADAVDRGANGAALGTRLEDAPDFDTFFGQLTGTLPQTWQ